MSVEHPLLSEWALYCKSTSGADHSDATKEVVKFDTVSVLLLRLIGGSSLCTYLRVCVNSPALHEKCRRVCCCACVTEYGHSWFFSLVTNPFTPLSVWCVVWFLFGSQVEKFWKVFNNISGSSDLVGKALYLVSVWPCGVDWMRGQQWQCCLFVLSKIASVIEPFLGGCSSGQESVLSGRIQCAQQEDDGSTSRKVAISHNRLIQCG